MSTDWQSLIQLTADDFFMYAVQDWTATEGNEDDQIKVKREAIKRMAAVSGVGYKRLTDISNGATVLEDEEFLLTIAACVHTPITACISCGVRSEWVDSALRVSFSVDH